MNKVLAREYTPRNKEEIIKQFAGVINRNSLENGSNTPDFLLAEYLYDCLIAYEKIHYANEKWYGKNLSIDGVGVQTIPES